MNTEKCGGYLSFKLYFALQKGGFFFIFYILLTVHLVTNSW